MPPQPPDWLLASGANLLNTGRRQGPAAARNLAAANAEGELLVFVDADVEVHADALDRFRAHFAIDPQLAAMFGSYDDQPFAPGLVSRFRILLHHHTHSSYPGPASTFWAGCGAIRHDIFWRQGASRLRSTNTPASKTLSWACATAKAAPAFFSIPPSRARTTNNGPWPRWWPPTSASVPSPGAGCCCCSAELPATLNLDSSARISGAASLGLSLAVGARLALPALRVWALMAVLEIGARPIAVPHGLRRHPELQRGLLIGTLALLALAATLKGLLLGWRLSDTELYERLDEWRLLQAGVYPSHRLATEAQQALPHFRTSVYLRWAHGYGVNQGGKLSEDY